jgi:hypothetical protein
MKANKVPDLDSMSTHGAAALRKSEPDALGQKHSILSGCSISFEISFEMLPFNDLWVMAVSQTAPEISPQACLAILFCYTHGHSLPFVLLWVSRPCFRNCKWRRRVATRSPLSDRCQGCKSPLEARKEVLDFRDEHWEPTSGNRAHRRNKGFQYFGIGQRAKNRKVGSISSRPRIGVCGTSDIQVPASSRPVVSSRSVLNPRSFVSAFPLRPLNVSRRIGNILPPGDSSLRLTHPSSSSEVATTSSIRHLAFPVSSGWSCRAVAIVKVLLPSGVKPS